MSVKPLRPAQQRGTPVRQPERGYVRPDVEQGLEVGAVGGFAAGQVEGDQVSAAVRFAVDLGRETAARVAVRLACLPLLLLLPTHGQRPTAGEIDICRWWLDSERRLVRPGAILALGASAARGVLGRSPAIGRERGRPIVQPDGSQVWITVHPSYLLRLRDEMRERETRRFDDDLAGLAKLLRF